jgi:preprotein translocase subunit SecD
VSKPAILLALAWIVLGFGAAYTDVAAQRSCPRVEMTLVEPSASAETRPVKVGRRTIFVRRDAITTTSDITEIKVAGDNVDTLIQIKYDAAAAARLLEATTDHDGLKMAFVVDNDVWLAFTWEGPYGIGPDGTQVSIPRGMARARKLVESLRGCTGKNANP